MTDQITDFKDYLKSGLRRNTDGGKNVPQLGICNNLRNTPYGLARHTGITPFLVNKNLVENGTFDLGSTNWTLGAGWAWGSSLVTHSSGTATLAQNSIIPAAGVYEIVFTVASRSAGTVTVSVAGVSGTARSTNATFTEYIRAAGSGNLLFTPTDTFDGSIDVVTLKSVDGPAAELVTNGTFTGASTGWTLNTGWTYASNKVTHTTIAETGTLEQDLTDIIDTATGAGYYIVTYDILDHTEGNLIVSLGDRNGTARTANGTYYDLLQLGTGTILAFTPGENFDGSVDNVSCKRVEYYTSWPAPRLFRREEAAVLVSHDGIFIVDMANETLTQIALYNAFSPASAIDVGHTAQRTSFAAFQDTWIVTDTGWTTYKLPGTASNKVVSFDSTAYTGIRACCQLGSRLFLGGFSEGSDSWLSSTRFTELFDTWKHNTSPDVFTSEDSAIGTNWCMWSTPSGGDYDVPFTCEMAIFGIPDTATYDLLRPHIIEDLKSGEMGFVRLPWTGNVNAMKQLGEAVMVYGSGGVSALVRSNDGYSAVKVLDVSVTNAGKVGGDESAHLFIDDKDDMWVITGDLQPKKIEYNEFLDDLTDAITAVSFDPQRREFYIADGSTGYLFSLENGLSQVSQMPSSLVFYGGTLYGIVNSEVQNTNFEIVTDQFDFGFKDIKTIHSVEVGTTDIEDLEIGVNYKYTNSTTFSSGSYVAANAEGIVIPIISGVDFQIKIRGNAGSAARIEYMNVRWRATVKRSLGNLL